MLPAARSPTDWYIALRRPVDLLEPEFAGGATRSSRCHRRPSAQICQRSGQSGLQARPQDVRLLSQVEEPVKHASAELKRIDWHTLIDAVKQRGEIEVFG